MWGASGGSSSSPFTRQAMNYGIPADISGMVVVAPAASFHHPHHHHDSSLMQTVEHQHNIIPLLSAAPFSVDDESSVRSKPSTGIQFWSPAQTQPHYHNQNPNPNATISYLKKPVPTTLFDSTGILSGVGGGSGSIGTTTCQDCGNQAKKDCSHRRCRSCCKSRGFDCSTHVKSTWVPASRRRERQQLAATVVPTGAAGSSASTSGAKKPRLLSSHTNTTTATTSHTSTSNTTPRSFDTTSSHHHQDASFRESLPSQLRAPAVFKCVRVTSIDDGEDQYAYHAMVKIGGHVFKGFLYDHGVDDNQATTSTGNNAANDAIPSLSELHLGAGGSSPMLPSDVFCGGGGGVTPGSGGLIGAWGKEYNP